MGFTHTPHTHGKAGDETNGHHHQRGTGRNKTWWARLVYGDEATGKRRDRQGRAQSYADAKGLAGQLAKEFDQPAEYHDVRKVAGVRGLATAKGRINALRAFFGKKRVRRITYADLRELRTSRLQTKDAPPRPRDASRLR